MTEAKKELKENFEKITDAIKKITSTDQNASIDAILIGGLHVATFVAIENFLKKRVAEILATLGQSVGFINLPSSLKSYVLQESIRGIDHCILKSRDHSDSQKIHGIQYEGALISQTSDQNADFIPSEYCFGRSKSNISRGAIVDIMNAFHVKDGATICVSIKDILGFTSSTLPLDVFETAAQERHLCAHSINTKYTPKDLEENLKGSYLLFCFVIDAILSSAAAKIIKSTNEGKAHLPTKFEDIFVRNFRFGKNWEEYRNEKFLRDIQISISARIKQFLASKSSNTESWIMIGHGRCIEDWGQPI